MSDGKLTQLSADELLARAYALDNEEDTKQLYTDWATTYDETMLDGLGYATPRKTASLLAEKITDKTARILDVGSGTGLAGRYLAEHGFGNIDALDYSPAMLAVAANRMNGEVPVYKNCIEADLNAELSLESNTYDAMICTGTFTHAHVGAQCLSELFRVLKPGGFFACTIQKDVWVEAGFKETVSSLAEQGVLRTLRMVMGIYFDGDEEPEGWYVIWEGLK